MKKSCLRNIVIIVSLFALVIAYCLLQPRVSGVFPFVRKIRLNTFLNSIKKTGLVSAQEFWQLREFYYPGLVTINRNGILDKKARSLNPKLSPLLFFQFNSRYILSDEYLVNSHDLSLIAPPNEGYVFNSDRSFAYRENKKTLDIVFIKPISEMTKANGFIYEKDQDKKLVKGKYWLVITKILK